VVKRISFLWYVNMIVTCTLSCHARTATSPECWRQWSLFFSFLFYSVGGTFFLPALKVPTQSVLFCTSWTEPTLVNYKNCPSTQCVHDQEGGLTVLVQFMQLYLFLQS
jgi:hypothetical protein